MKADATSMGLAELQRAMAAAVMMPLTADEEMRPVAPDGRAMAEIAASFIAPNSRLTAFERLELYNRQYWLRVLGSLAEDFPAVRAVVGREAVWRDVGCVSVRAPQPLVYAAQFGIEAGGVADRESAVDGSPAWAGGRSGAHRVGVYRGIR